MISCALVKLARSPELEVVRLATVGVKASPIMATTKAAIITPVVIVLFPDLVLAFKVVDRERD